MYVENGNKALLLLCVCFSWCLTIST